jgi:2-methylisocitrate lyase-like PEP mutase family enzyme
MNPDAFAARRAEFRKLHESGFFVIPNPWDVGTARYLRSLGFKALATTSSGLAFSQGLPDADWAIPRDVALEHIHSIVTAVDLPVNADFESGYAHSPAEVAENVSLCIATGVAGLSIEDATGDAANPLYDLPLAVERIRAAREATASSGVLLTARAECFLVDCPDPLREAILRLTAYAEAGADVLYAPGASTRAEVEAIVSAVRPKPVNVLLASSRGLSLRELAAIGVRRVSVGSALARVAWSGFLHAATLIARDGSMEGLDNAVPFSELNNFFRKDVVERAAEEFGQPSKTNS